MRKPATLPNICLGGRIQIIDDTTEPPQWKTLARCFATDKNARAVARKHGLSGVWVLDDYGYRWYVSAHLLGV